MNRNKPHISFWIIAALSLLWNSMGAMDYYMTQTRNMAYLSRFTPDQIAYFTSFPAWMAAAWAFGVWGAVLGSILLLLRSRWAVPVFGISLLGLIISTIWQVFGSETSAFSMMGQLEMAFMVAIWVVAIALLFYARWMQARGVLR
jgi:hypothetical protein